VGAQLQVIHSFLLDWYSLWTDEGGQRRSLTDAQIRFEAWRTRACYALSVLSVLYSGHDTKTIFE
jgi:hypothetical protein